MRDDSVMVSDALMDMEFVCGVMGSKMFLPGFRLWGVKRGITWPCFVYISCFLTWFSGTSLPFFNLPVGFGEF